MESYVAIGIAVVFFTMGIQWLDWHRLRTAFIWFGLGAVSSSYVALSLFNWPLIQEMSFLNSALVLSVMNVLGMLGILLWKWFDKTFPKIESG